MTSKATVRCIWPWLVAMAAWVGSATLQADPAFDAQLKAAEEKAQVPNAGVWDWIEVAKLCHNHAATNATSRSACIRQAEAALKRALEIEPTNACACALAGSLMTITAHEVWFPTTKIGRVRRGIEMMDAAVAAAPENLEARFTRACNNMQLPEMFHRREVAKADFDWLEERIDAGKMTADSAQYVRFYHGKAWLRWGDKAAARAVWARGIEVDPKSKWAEKMRREIALTQAPK